MLLAGCLLAAGGIWYLCERSDSTAFLTTREGAEWILDDMPVNIRAHPAVTAITVFKKDFAWDATSGEVRLEMRAFKSAAVSVNGQEISLTGDPQHWKSDRIAILGGQLRAGTNEIVVAVTNTFGPPALWLRLKAGSFALGTDASWISTSTGSHWLPARLAGAPLPLRGWTPLENGNHIGAAFRRIWMPLGLAVIAALLSVMLAAKHWPAARARPEKYLWLLLALVVSVRAVLWLNNIAVLSPTTGFDSGEHDRYIQFILQHHALPLPNDGWEMHQPPLYYMVCALWLGALGLDTTTPAAFTPLHAVNGVIGLAQCVLALLCLRRLFPRNFSVQAAGLLIAAFLPPNLYLSLYVTNDPLAGLLVSAALYFYLRWRENSSHAAGFAAGLGLALGAAVLTKLNSILAVPVFLAAMGMEIFVPGKFSLRKVFSGPGLALAACLLACGWHYLRVWHQIGALPLPNSQNSDASAWWQQPGYRSAGYYLHFGQSLFSPLYSALNSFADGMYSTWWADGLTSGASDQVFRPPWYYDWMTVGGLLALPLTLLAVAGFFRCLYRLLFHRLDAWSLIMAGTPLIFGAGIFYLTLRGPWLAHVKAFYALPALIPFCGLIGEGWTWLAQKGRRVEAGLWTAVLVWTMVTIHAFWMGFGNFEVYRTRAIDCLRTHDFDHAFSNAAQAIKLNPADADIHCVLAETWDNAGQPAYAVQEFLAALQIQPDAPYTLNSLASVLCLEEKGETARAVEIAHRACELTGYREAEFMTTLATAYDKNGQFTEAVDTAFAAWQLARLEGETGLMKHNLEILDRRTAGEKAP